MQTVRTIVCNLAPTPEQRAEIDATLQAFAAACNRIAEVCRTIHSSNKVKVQAECYPAIRAEFGLSANLTIRAIARVCAALKVKEKMHSAFEPTSIDYDQRIFSFREWDWTFSLTLLHSRQRIETILGERQKSALRGKNPTSATLVKRRDGRYFLHVQIKDEAPEPIKTTGALGVDLGVVHLAVDSTGEVFSGDKVEEVRRRYGQRRRNLNKCGSKSARRRLRQIRRKESRFRANENHIISKRLVTKAQDTGSAIILENLAGIGERTTARKSEQSRMKGWAFYQLRCFIVYKALAAGVPVLFVDPRNTSRTCSVCGYCHKSNRRSRDLFVCRHCGFSCNADWNAAKNIRTIGAKSCALPNAGVVDSGAGTRTRLPASPRL